MASVPPPTTGLPPIPPNISELTAPMLIGALLNYALYGVLCVQVYIYHISFPKDKLWTKALVWGMFILETAQVCLAAADIYYWFGSGYGNMERLGSTYLSPFDTPLMGSLTSFTVQIFFCYRIWALRRDCWPLCVSIGAIALSQLYGGIAGGVRGYLNKSFALSHIHIEDAYLWLVGNAAADFLIAVTMTFLLLKARQREHRFTNDIILRLVRLVMETNSLTAGVAVLSMILFVSFPNDNFFICPTLVSGKLYSNTLLVTFNNRIFIGNRPEHTRDLSALEARSGPMNSLGSEPHSFTLNSTRAYGFKDYKVESLGGGHDVEMAIDHQMISEPKVPTAQDAF